MKILLFERLPRYRKMLITIMFVIMVESFAASISIVMLIPIFHALMSEGNSRIPGLPIFMQSFLEQMPAAWVVIGFGVILLGKGILGLSRQILEGHLLRKLRHEWTLNLSRKAMFESYAESEGKRAGHALNVASREILRAGNYVTAVLTFISSCAYVLAIALTASVVNWKLMLGIGMLMALFYMAIFRHVMTYSSENGVKTLHLVQDLMSQVNENLSNLKEIKILNIERWRLHFIERRSHQVGKQEMRYAIIQAVPISLNEGLFALATIAFGCMLLLGLRLDSGQFLPILPFFTVATYKIVTSAASLASHRIKAINRESSFRAVCDLSLTKQENLSEGEGINLLKTEISFSDVHFSYPDGTKILEGFNCHIQPGRTIFLQGRSGTGKSTLLDLLTRLREVNRGAITANGKDIQQFNLKNWRRLFGYVGQDPHLFYGTIQENIALDEPVGLEEVMQAASLAGIAEFIEALPRQYLSPVGERGLNLSGGQRRRIALARALVRNPKIILLDETTSAFESSLEREILLRLKAIGGITVIVVSHRADNLDMADKIVDMNKAFPEADRLSSAQS